MKNFEAQSRFIILAVTGLALLGIWQVAFPFKSSVEWRTDLPAALADAMTNNQPVLINFSSKGCTYCKQMEAEVFPTRDVQSALGDFIPVKIDVDVQEELAARYEVMALPTFVITDASGTSIAAAVGFYESPQFSAFLRNGANAAKN